MIKTFLVMMALVTISGPALAGGEFHFEVDANGETHTIDATVGDDGSASVLVDGEPVGAPEAPEVPETPEAPEAPELPALP